jgi:hypothetical protein
MIEAQLNKCVVDMFIRVLVLINMEAIGIHEGDIGPNIVLQLQNGDAAPQPQQQAPLVYAAPPGYGGGSGAGYSGCGGAGGGGMGGNPGSGPDCRKKVVLGHGCEAGVAY